MTNQVAEAIVLCEAQIKEWQEVFEEVVRFTDADFQKRQIFAWTTHLAEFQEHESIYEKTSDEEDYWYCKFCGDLPSNKQFCNFITTKAQRLLGNPK